MADENLENDPLQSLIAEILEAEAKGEIMNREEVLRQHSEHEASLREFFVNHDSMRSGGADEATLPPATSQAEDTTLPPGLAAGDDVTLPHTGNQASHKTKVGETVRYFGDYELLEEIARGGMGVVYKARQINLNRIVALKMILSGQLASEEDVKRFYTEAEAAANLDHPGIVPIFEVGQHQGQHYFSMGYIEGQSLAQKVANGPLPPREAAELVKKICEAMSYAHERGVIHRDLKPANILLDPNGQPKVTDFGLAKQMNVDSGLTGTGQILGTPSYMAPEQANGKVDEVGPPADVYALGAILYCLLTGRPPFQAANPMDTLLQVLDKEPIAPTQQNSAIPRDLETLCLKCLEKDIARRYSSSSLVNAELQRFLNGEPILARKMNPLVRTTKKSFRKHPALWRVGLAMAFALTVWQGSFQFWLWDRGTISFTNYSAQFLVCEVKKEVDGNLIARAEVPSKSPLTISSGEYIAQVTNREGDFQNWQMHVQRGKEISYEVPSPWNEDLWNSTVGTQYWQVTTQNDKPMIVVPNDNEMSLIDGVTGEAKWRVKAAMQKSSSECLLMQPLQDCNRDGIDDLILAQWGAKSFTVLSGETGKTLWQREKKDRTEMIFGPIFAEVNGDGIMDVVSLSLLRDWKFANLGGNATIEALSGETGELLWKHELGEQRLVRQLGADGPVNNFTPGNNFSQLHLVIINGEPAVVYAAEKKIVMLDAKSGTSIREPIELEACSARPLRFFSTDTGTGVLLVLPDPASKASNVAVLESWSLDRGEKLWRVNPTFDREFSWLINQIEVVDFDGQHAVSWPLVVDMNSDGKDEIIVPSIRKKQPICMLDTLGRPIWYSEERLKFNPNGMVGRITRDIDHDGWKDIMIFCPAEEAILTLSGKNGKFLQSCKLPGGLLGDSLQSTRFLNWLPDIQRHDDQGYPYCSLATNRGVFIFSSRTGELIYQWMIPETLDMGMGALRVGVLDLDQDGLQDLLLSNGRFLRAVPILAEAWRRLGNWQAGYDYDGDEFADLVSCNSYNSDEYLEVISGKSGKHLWSENFPAMQVICLAPEYGDLDRDAVPDIVVFDHKPSRTEYEPNPLTIRALSGKSGGVLWTSILEGFSAREVGSWSPKTFELTELPDADGDGVNDLILRFSIITQSKSQEQNRHGSQAEEYWQGMISGYRGKVLWQKFIKKGWDRDAEDAPPLFADLDGDHLMDVLFCSPCFAAPEDRQKLRNVSAVRGIDGKQIWQHSFEIAEDSMLLMSAERFCLPLNQGAARACLIGDLENDQVVDVVIGDRTGEIRAFNGKTGEKKWSWKMPNAPGIFGPKICLADMNGDKRAEVYVTQGYSEGFLCVLDHHGSVIQQIDNNPNWSQVNLLHAADLDDDGDDELIALSAGGKLSAYDNSLADEKWIWTSRLSSPGLDTTLLEITHGKDGPQLVLASYNYNKNQTEEFLVIDTTSGKEIWQLRVPPHLRVQSRYLLNGNSAPSCVFTSGIASSNAICRQAWRAN